MESISWLLHTEQIRLELSPCFAMFDGGIHLICKMGNGHHLKDVLSPAHAFCDHFPVWPGKRLYPRKSAKIVDMHGAPPLQMPLLTTLPNMLHESYSQHTETLSEVYMTCSCTELASMWAGMVTRPICRCIFLPSLSQIPSWNGWYNSTLPAQQNPLGIIIHPKVFVIAFHNCSSLGHHHWVERQ